MSNFIRPWDTNTESQEQEQVTPRRSLIDNLGDAFNAVVANFNDVRGTEKLGDLRQELMNSGALSNEEFDALKNRYIQQSAERQAARDAYQEAQNNLVADDSFLKNLTQMGGTIEGMAAQGIGTAVGAGLGFLSPVAGGTAMGAKVGNAAGAIAGGYLDAKSVALQAQEDVLKNGGTWEQAEEAYNETLKKASLTTLPETLVDIAMGNRLVGSALNSRAARKIAGSTLGRMGSAVLDPAAKIGTKAALKSGQTLVGRGAGILADTVLQGSTEAGQEVLQDYIENREVAKAMGREDNEYSLGGFKDYALSDEGLETMKTAGIMGALFGGVGGTLSSGQYLTRGAETNTGIRAHNNTEKMINDGSLKIDKERRQDEEKIISALTGISPTELATWSDADIVAEASILEGQYMGVIGEAEDMSTTRGAADVVRRLTSKEDNTIHREGDVTETSRAFLKGMGVDDGMMNRMFNSPVEKSLMEKARKEEEQAAKQEKTGEKPQTTATLTAETGEQMKKTEGKTAIENIKEEAQQNKAETPTVTETVTEKSTQNNLAQAAQQQEQQGKIDTSDNIVYKDNLMGGWETDPDMVDEDEMFDQHSYYNIHTEKTATIARATDGGFVVKTQVNANTENMPHFNTLKEAENYLFTNKDNVNFQESNGEQTKEGTTEDPNIVPKDGVDASGQNHSGALINSVDDLFNFMQQNPGLLSRGEFIEFVHVKHNLGVNDLSMYLDRKNEGRVYNEQTGQWGYVNAKKFHDEATGRAMIQLYRGGDIISAVHEIAHVGYENLSNQDKATFNRYAVKSMGQWIADMLDLNYDDNFKQRLHNLQNDEELRKKIEESPALRQTVITFLNAEQNGVDLNNLNGDQIKAIDERWAWEFSLWYSEGYLRGVEPKNMVQRIYQRGVESLERELNMLQRLWEHIHHKDNQDIESLYMDRMNASAERPNTSGQNASPNMRFTSELEMAQMPNVNTGMNFGGEQAIQYNVPTLGESYNDAQEYAGLYNELERRYANRQKNKGLPSADGSVATNKQRPTNSEGTRTTTTGYKERTTVPAKNKKEAEKLVKIIEGKKAGWEKALEKLAYVDPKRFRSVKIESGNDLWNEQQEKNIENISKMNFTTPEIGARPLPQTNFTMPNLEAQPMNESVTRVNGINTGRPLYFNPTSEQTMNKMETIKKEQQEHGEKAEGQVPNEFKHVIYAQYVTGQGYLFDYDNGTSRRVSQAEYDRYREIQDKIREKEELEKEKRRSEKRKNVPEDRWAKYRNKDGIISSDSEGIFHQQEEEIDDPIFDIYDDPDAVGDAQDYIDALDSYDPSNKLLANLKRKINSYMNAKNQVGDVDYWDSAYEAIGELQEDRRENDGIISAEDNGSPWTSQMVFDNMKEHAQYLQQQNEEEEIQEQNTSVEEEQKPKQAVENTTKKETRKEETSQPKQEEQQQTEQEKPTIPTDEIYSHLYFGKNDGKLTYNKETGKITLTHWEFKLDPDTLRKKSTKIIDGEITPEQYKELNERYKNDLKKATGAKKENAPQLVEGLPKEDYMYSTYREVKKSDKDREGDLEGTVQLGKEKETLITDKGNSSEIEKSNREKINKEINKGTIYDRAKQEVQNEEKENIKKVVEEEEKTNKKTTNKSNKTTESKNKQADPLAELHKKYKNITGTPIGEKGYRFKDDEKQFITAFKQNIDRAVGNKEELLKVSKQLDGWFQNNPTERNRMVRKYLSNYLVDAGQIKVDDGVRNQESNKAERAQEILDKAFPNTRFQVAWHGSPYDFSEFTLKHLGEGEGEAVIAKGLYFSEKMMVAKNYYDLTKSKNVEIYFNNKKIDLNYDDGLKINGIKDKQVLYGLNADDFNRIIETIYFADDARFNNINYDKVLSGLEKEIENTKAVMKQIKEKFKEDGYYYNPDTDNAMYSEDELKDYLKKYEDDLREQQRTYRKFRNIKNLNVNFRVKKTGNDNATIYRVEIPDDNKLIHEGQKLKDQPKYIKDRILKMIKDNPTYFNKPTKEDFEKRLYFDNGDTNLPWNYDAFDNIKDGEFSLEDLLHKYGIDGIVYKGVDSPGSWVDDRCFVIWDDKSIKILDKFQKEEEKWEKNNKNIDNTQYIKANQQKAQRKLEKRRQQDDGTRFMFGAAGAKNQTILNTNKEKQFEKHFRAHMKLRGFSEKFIDEYFSNNKNGEEQIIDDDKLQQKGLFNKTFIDTLNEYNNMMQKKAGVKRGLDGRWRFEFSDKDSHFDKNSLSNNFLDMVTNLPKQKGMAGKLSGKLQDVFDHKLLYKYYPQFKDLKISFCTADYFKKTGLDLNVVGAYNNGEILINIDYLKKQKTIKAREVEVKQTILHEIQHAIQDYEGLAEGAGSTSFERQLRQRKLVDSYIKKLGGQKEAGQKLLNAINDVIKNIKKVPRNKRGDLYKKIRNNAEYFNDTEQNFVLKNPRAIIEGYMNNYQDVNKKYGRYFDNEVKEMCEYLSLSKDLGLNRELLRPIDQYQKLYWTHLGEIEARQTEQRMDMTDEERLKRTDVLDEGIKNLDILKDAPLVIKRTAEYSPNSNDAPLFQESNAPKNKKMTNEEREEKEYNKRKERVEKAKEEGTLSDQMKDVYSVSFTKSAQEYAENRTKMEYFDNNEDYWDRTEDKSTGKVTYVRKTPYEHQQKVVTYNGVNDVKRENKKKSKPVQWMEWMKDQLIKYMFNDKHYLAKAARKLGVYDAYRRMIVTEGYALKANTALTQGIKYNGKTTRALNDIIRDVGEPKQKAFLKYCIAHRILDLKDRENPVFQKMKPDEARKYIEEIKASPDAELFERNRKDFVEYNKALLHVLVDGGIMDEKTFQKFCEVDPNFVPLTKVMDDADMGFRSIINAHNLVNLKSPIKKIGTSMLEIANPFLEMQKRTAEYYAIASRNKAGQIFVNEIAGALDVKYNGDVIARGQQMLHRVRVDERNGQLITKPDEKQQIIYVCNNGKHEFYQVADKEIYQALTFMNADQMGTIHKMLDNIAHVPSGLIRETATMVPDFGVRNVIRDGGEAFLTSEHGFLPVIDQIWGMWQVMNNTEWAQMYFNQNGEYGTLNRDRVNSEGIASVDDVIDEKLNPLKNFKEIKQAQMAILKDKQRQFSILTDIKDGNFGDAWEHTRKSRGMAALKLAISPLWAIGKSNKRMNDLFELGTRVGEFKNAKMGFEGTLDRIARGIMNTNLKEAELQKKAQSDVYAAHVAKDITLNFSQHGKLGKELNRYIPFFNASLQGIYKLCNTLETMATGTTISGGKNRRLQQELLFKAALITAMAIGVAAAGDGDEDYEEAPDYEKENFWILPNGLRFPKDQVLGKIIGNTVEKSYAQWKKGKAEPSTILKSILENFKPDRFMFAIFDLAIGGFGNYDTFKERYIVPEYMADKLGHLQKDISTSNFAVDVSEALWKCGFDISAKKIDWALQKNFSNCAKYATAIYDLGKKTFNPKEFNERIARGYDKNDSTGSMVAGLKDDIPSPISLVSGTFATNRSSFKSISDFYENYKKYKKLSSDEASMSKEDKRMWKRYEQAYKKDMTFRKQLRAIKQDRTLTGKQKREKADKIFKQQIKLAKWAEG